MKKSFLLSTRIRGANSDEENVLACRVLTGEIELLNQTDETNLEKFLQRLFQIIVKSQGETCDFSIITEEYSSFDDMERAVFEGKFRPSLITPIDKENIKISFSEGDDSWCYPDFIFDRVEYSFIAHILVLSILETALKYAAEEEKVEVFECTTKDLRRLCAEYVKIHDELSDSWLKVEKEKSDKNREFLKKLQDIEDGWIPT